MSSATPLTLQLVLPGLVPEAQDAWPAILGRLPALHRLLARAQSATTSLPHVPGLLLAAFGVGPAPDWPVAPFTLLADGLAPGDAYWLRADPVHLLLQQHDLVLVDSDHLALRADECESVISTLDQHFRVDGIRFSAPHPSRWYLRSPQPLRIRSQPPETAVGRGIDPLLPQGEDAMQLHRWSNEIQMLLHDHPVNRQREARGEPAVNSLWLWGAGTLPADDRPSVASVWADDPLARGLARASALPVHATPASAPDWLAAAAGGEDLVVIDALAVASRRSDTADWEAHARALEQAWFSPLLAALSAGQLRQVTLATCHGGQALRFTVTAPDLWKLWRRAVRMPAPALAPADG